MNALKVYQRNWYDDGDDCISSSFAEALRLTYGDDALTPDVPEIEWAYRLYHPGWPDTASTVNLSLYWQALADIGVWVEALHQRGPIPDQLALELAADRFPVAWIYLPDGRGGFWHHAVVYTGETAGRMEFWDQQTGEIRSCTRQEFLTPGSSPLSSSGYAYSARYLPAEEPAPETPMPDRVVNVVTADTKRDISDLINAAAAKHGFSAVGFLGGLIGESNLHEHAVRERRWPDVSYGLSQPTVAYLDPDSGLPLVRGSGNVVLDLPANRLLVREWAHDAANLIPYTARRYAALLKRAGVNDDPLRAWSAWNAPARTLEQNEAAQPHAIANYRRGLAEAERYRATGGADMAGIVDLRGKLQTRGAYSKRPVSGITSVTYHYTAGGYEASVRSVADWQMSDAAAGQFGGQPAPGIAYTAIVKGDGLPHLCWDLDVRVWHAGSPWNDTSIGICYIGNGPPRPDQILGLAKLHVWCERQLGRQLAVRGHKDAQATSCPGDWPTWKADLIAAIDAAREASASPPPHPGNAVLYAEIEHACLEIVAAATEARRLSLPVYRGGPEMPDAEAVGGIMNALTVIDRWRLKAIDDAGQIRV